MSIEVDPRLAHDTAATIAQARELAKIVDRPNVLIKIPATRAGLPAITAAIAEGISVNATLIFSLGPVCRRHGRLPDRPRAGHVQAATTSPKSIPSPRSSSPGSIPKSTGVCNAIGTPTAAGRCSARPRSPTPGCLPGPRTDLHRDRWAASAAAGANKQRPLWASTGVKDPKYDDTRYVVELVAPGTVNTAPKKTIDAVRDHGTIRGNTIEGTYAHASRSSRPAGRRHRSRPTCSRSWKPKACEKFEQSWTELLESIGQELGRHKAAANNQSARCRTLQRRKRMPDNRSHPPPARVEHAVRWARWAWSGSG